MAPENGCFRADLDLAADPLPITYKYGIYDLEKNAFVRYEEGDNRVLAEAAPPRGQVICQRRIRALAVRTLARSGRGHPGFQPCAAKQVLAWANFLDLPLLADWARRAGLKLIQILPVNDTTATHTWMDSYPYAAISAFALHPLYLNLDRLAECREPAFAREPGQPARNNSMRWTRWIMRR